MHILEMTEVLKQHDQFCSFNCTDLFVRSADHEFFGNAPTRYLA